MSKVLFNLIYYKSCFAKGEEHPIHVTTETPIFSNCFRRHLQTIFMPHTCLVDQIRRWKKKIKQNESVYNK